MEAQKTPNKQSSSWEVLPPLSLSTHHFSNLKELALSDEREEIPVLSPPGRAHKY